MCQGTEYAPAKTWEYLSEIPQFSIGTKSMLALQNNNICTQISQHIFAPKGGYCLNYN